MPNIITEVLVEDENSVFAYKSSDDGIISDSPHSARNKHMMQWNCLICSTKTAPPRRYCHQCYEVCLHNPILNMVILNFIFSF